MPKITISNLGQKVVNFYLNNEAPKSVLAIIQDNFIDWMHACGGKGRCTSCRCIIEEGKQYLKEKTDAEIKFFEANLLRSNERLACQAIPINDIVLKVPDRCKLPGVTYTN